MLNKRKTSAPELELLPKKLKMTENFDPVALENISGSVGDQSLASE
jgi:hypothetical protein